MKLGQIISSYKKSSFLQTYPVWNKEVKDVSGVEIVAAIEQYRLHHQSDIAAIMEIETLMVILRKMIKEGKYEECELASINIPSRRYFFDELEIVLNMLSLHRRYCVIYALLTHTDITEAETLKWRDIIRKKHSRHIKELVANIPRHINCDYVFWEQSGNVALPIISTRTFLKERLGIEWEWLQYAFDNMNFVRLE